LFSSNSSRNHVWSSTTCSQRMEGAMSW
jgi:hypothetical protein